MTERDEDDFRAQLASVRTKLSGVERHLDTMHADQQAIADKVNALVVAEAKREGREEARERREDYQHDDRWQVWLRHFIPAGIFAGVWTAIWRFFGNN